MVRGDVSKAILEQIKTMSVSEIAAARGTSVQNVSNLLRLLETNGLVVHEARGKWRVVEVVKDEPSLPE